MNGGAASAPADPLLHGASILVVDDEAIIREVLDELLARGGCRVHLATDGAEGVGLAMQGTFDAVLLDVMMPGMDGMAALEKLHRFDPDLPVIMVTAYGTARSARDALKRGAFDFIEKPFQHADVLDAVRNAVEHRRQATARRARRTAIEAGAHRFGGLLGSAPRMQELFNLIASVAPSRTTVLVTGESGTGKELVARALHDNSPRADRAFVPVNSGSLPADLLESNLFGHVKGAFTGAIAPKKGLFELADRGSIFFDEIGTVPLDTQAKLLRVIQEREFMRLGGVDTVRVDVRIIAATNQDLRSLVEAGQFREDLFYRLHVITVDLPPLRERREDVPLLAQHFLEQHGQENGKPDLVLTPEALGLLEAHHWPGNVRELGNVIERVAVLTGGMAVGAHLIRDALRTSPSLVLPDDIPPDGIPFREIIEQTEARLIVQALEKAGGVQKKAAELLRIKPTTLHEMMKRHGIRAGRTRPGALAGSSAAPAPGAPAAPGAALSGRSAAPAGGGLLGARAGRSGSG